MAVARLLTGCTKEPEKVPNDGLSVSRSFCGLAVVTVAVPLADKVTDSVMGVAMLPALKRIGARPPGSGMTNSPEAGLVYRAPISRALNSNPAA